MNFTSVCLPGPGGPGTSSRQSAPCRATAHMGQLSRQKLLDHSAERILNEGPGCWGTSRVLLVVRVTVLRPPEVGVARAPAVPLAEGGGRGCQSASPSGILSAGGPGLLLRHNVLSGQATPVMEHSGNGRSCSARRTSAPWGHAEVTLCCRAQARWGCSGPTWLCCPCPAPPRRAAGQTYLLPGW